MRTTGARWPRLLGELAARALLVAAVVHFLPHIFVGDISHFRGLARQVSGSRLPYRSVHWEFPPLTLVFVLLEKVSFGSRAVYLTLFAAVTVVLELASLEVLRRAWPSHDRQLTWIWVATVLPVATLAWFRTDFLAVFFAALALVGIERRRATTLPIVAGVASKLWPGLLLVVVAVERRWRSFVAGVAGSVVLIVAWYLYSPSGFRWFVRYRAGDGLEVESVPASLRLLGHHGAFRVRSGAWVIDANGFAWVDGVLGVGLVVFIVAIGWWAYRRESCDRVALGGALVLASMLFSRLLSAQYIVWMGPFVAILWVRGHRMIGWLAIVAGWLTFAYLLWFDDGLLRHSKLVAGVVIARNAALVALLILFVLAVRTPDARKIEARALLVGDPPAGHPDTVAQPDRRAARRTAIGALVVSASATSVALIGGHRLVAGSYFVALCVAFAAFAVLMFSLRDSSVLSAWPIIVVGGALLIVALVQPPVESGDVWSYASYGRMVVAHHESPWTHVPADHPGDPYTPLVAHAWRQTPSVYGPAFAGPAAVVMAVAGTHTTVARFGFQMLAAISVALALWLVGRETRWDPTAIAILSVNPFIPVCVVNGGHNDAWVGVLLLGAVLLTMRERWVWAGAVVAVAAMVKITALLAVVALAVWAWRRAGRRAAVRVAASAALASSAMVLAAGGADVVRAMRWNSWRMTSDNLWARSRGWVFGELGGAHRADQAHLATLAVLVTVAFATFLVTRHRRASHPALLVGLTVIAYALVSAYLWPWYVVWGLIPLAICPRAPTTRLLLGVAALLELAAVPGIHTFSHGTSVWEPALRSARLVQEGLPWALAALAGTVVIVALVRWRQGGTMSTESPPTRW